MEPFNYVCTHLERVDELLAMLVLLFLLLVFELGLLLRSHRRHAKIASKLLELKQQKLTKLGTNQFAIAPEYLNQAADRKTKVKYQVENGTKGTQTQTN